MIKRILYGLSFCSALAAPYAYAQEAQPPKDRIVTLAVENDKFGGASDRHYTSGVRLTWLDPNIGPSETTAKWANYIPFVNVNDQSAIIYSLGHNLYTPEDITKKTAQPDDRPWAAFLYGSVGLVAVEDNHVNELEATIGMVGPAALGEPIQDFIHENISNSPEPQGWDRQLKNEPGLMLSAQRRWPNRLQAQAGPFMASLTPYAGATVGNVYTYANTGVGFQLGTDAALGNDWPLRVRPAMPGTGYFEPPEGFVGWRIFGGVEGRAVGRNIFLDGNSFADSEDVDKEVLVADANLGVAFTMGPTRISYTIIYRTKEFETQEKEDIFGAMSVGLRF